MYRDPLLLAGDALEVALRHIVFRGMEWKGLAAEQLANPEKSELGKLDRDDHHIQPQRDR